MRDISNKNRNEIIREVVVLALLPVVLVVFIGILFELILGEWKENEMFSILTICLSMVISMVLFPIFYLSKVDGETIKLSSLEPRFFMTDSFFIILMVILILFLFKVLFYHEEAIYAIFRNLPIAFCEEFWSKRVLYIKFDQLFSMKFMTIFFSAIVFAFVTHIGEPFFDNLFIRLPFGILMGFIYSKTKNIKWPFLLHLAYNVMIS